MEEKLAVVLPDEVAVLAQNVSVEKRDEVLSVITHVFNGIEKMRSQLDAIKVEDENDTTAMKLCKEVRLAVRKTRLVAEDKIDIKRADVQQKMAGFKTEDSLWLKVKQIVQIMTKEIEANAKWKEDTRIRFEAEQAERKVQKRILQVSTYSDTMPRSEFENMSDLSFELFIEGLERQHKEKIEAERKAEEERVARKEAERLEQERIKAENERLKQEAELKEKQLAQERAKADAEREEAASKLIAEQEANRIVIQKAQEEKAKLEAELKAKADAELKAKQDAELKLIAEQKTKELADMQAKNAPDKEKLKELATKIREINIPVLRSVEAIQIADNVVSLLDKTVAYLEEKIKTL